MPKKQYLFALLCSAAALLGPADPGSTTEAGKAESADRPFFLFSADHYYKGRQLYSSDGTRENTRVLLTLNGADVETWALPGRVVVVATSPGSEKRIYSIDASGRKSSVSDGRLSAVRGITLVGIALNKLWLVTEGDEYLISTDGSDAGTRIYPLAPGIAIREVFKFRDKAHFINENGADYGRLYAIEKGKLQRLAKLPFEYGRATPMIGYAGFSTAEGAVSVVAMGDRFLLPVESVQYGREVWASDGTAKGTKILKNIGPYNEGGLQNFHFRRVGAKVMFVANTVSAGSELWATDGTTRGTFMVKDLRRGSNGSMSDIYSVRSGKKAYFPASFDDSGHNTIWETDGTAAGTRMLSPKVGGQPVYVSFAVRQMVVFRGDLYFGGYSPVAGSSQTFHNGFYKYSFASRSTTLISRITEDGCVSGLGYRNTGSTASEMTSFKDGVLFSASNRFGETKAVEDCTSGAASNEEPWIFRASAGTAMMLRDISEGPKNASQPRNITAPLPVED